MRAVRRAVAALTHDFRILDSSERIRHFAKPHSSQHRSCGRAKGSLNVLRPGHLVSMRPKRTLPHLAAHAGGQVPVSQLTVSRF